MYSLWRFDNNFKKTTAGSCSLISIQIPDEFFEASEEESEEESERFELNKENKIYLILTCAHNIAYLSALDK